MFSISEKNYFINMSLIILGLACALSGFFIKSRIGLPMNALHELTGYLVTALAVVHLAMHNKWVCSVTKNLLSSKKKVVALALSVIVPLAICSGVLLFGKQVGGGQRPDGQFPRGDFQREHFNGQIEGNDNFSQQQGSVNSSTTEN